MALVWTLHARAAQASAGKSQRALSSGDLSLHQGAVQRIDTRPLAAIHDASLQSCAGMPPNTPGRLPGWGRGRAADPSRQTQTGGGSRRTTPPAAPGS